MQCVKVIVTADGGSRFGDIDVEQLEASYAENVPSLFVSQPARLAASASIEIETSDGDRRTVSPGDGMFFEDTTGAGHVTRVLRGPASFVAVSLADSALQT